METLRQRSPVRSGADVSHRGHICLAAEGWLVTPNRSQHWQEGEEEVGRKTDRCRRCESHCCWWRGAVSTHITTKLIETGRKNTCCHSKLTYRKWDLQEISRLFKPISWCLDRWKSVLVSRLTLTPSGERGEPLFVLSAGLWSSHLWTRTNLHRRASLFIWIKSESDFLNLSSFSDG